MNIGIISRSNLEDRVFWSGIENALYTQLKSSKYINVIKIDKLNNSLRKIFALKREYMKYINNVKYDDIYNNIVSKNFSKQIEKKIKNVNLDFLLVFDSSLVAYLDTSVPIILWTDILYSEYYNHYFKHKNISNDTKRDIKNLERKTITKCSKVFLSSEWALKKAKKKYKNFYKKFYHLNLGPSFRKNIPIKHVKNLIKKRPINKINLITLSVDWKRKGLNEILKINKIINRKGIKCYLTIIGLKQKNYLDDKNVNFLGFINKNHPKGEKIISDNLIKNHFHLLLSKSEAYGLALVEANSRGVPNVTFNVGGISQIIKNDINGKIFNKNECLNKIANYIIKTSLNRKRYDKLALSSYREYKYNYSYDRIINKFIKLINN